MLGIILGVKKFADYENMIAEWISRNLRVVLNGALSLTYGNRAWQGAAGWAGLGTGHCGTKAARR